ncbi:MAG TPA: PAS domain-containing protein [Acidobacteriaceae bacterium]|nr:PAS domain-containing protein [Acidobacteriaceae bacterium]
MARLVRSLDWSRSPLGPVGSWPDALVILANTILANRHPMFLFWGERLTQIYNDAAIPFLSPDKHPRALGQDADECWADAWPVVGHQVQAALEGEACWNEDQFVPIFRQGHLQDAWFTYSYSPSRDAQGTIRGVLVTALETTAQMLAQRALRGERERLLSLFQQAPAFFAVLKGPDHVFEMVNPPYLRIVGGRDVLGKPLREALPDVVDQGYGVILDRVYRTGEPFIGQGHRFTLSADQRHPREERQVDFAYQPLRESDGAISGILVFGVDITERRLGEQLLHDQRERFDFATAAAGIGYWFCDLPFDKVIWDARVKEHFWLSPEGEVDIRLFYALLHPDDCERTRQAIEDAIANHTAYNVEYRTMASDGRCKWIHAIGRTAYDASGQPLRFDGVTHDVTNLRAAQDARSRAEDALIRTEKLALVGRLAATISHEINNPLESINNLLYLIRTSTQEEECRRFTEIAEKELARVSHIVTHTLRFNRRANFASEETLSDLLDASLAIYEGRMRHSGIHLVRDYAPSASLCCFAAELRQVFANLIANSFDATKDGGTVQVRARSQTDWRTGLPGVRISIADTGHGIEPAVLLHLFEPFFTMKGENGTGLGLWVSREILAKHHASIRVRSRSRSGSSGTVFAIWLPLPGIRQGVESAA